MCITCTYTNTSISWIEKRIRIDLVTVIEFINVNWSFIFDVEKVKIHLDWSRLL